MTEKTLNETTAPEVKQEGPGFIFPTVGRRIYYRPATDDRNMNNLDIDMPPGSGQPMDAGIVYVHNPRLVNLAIHDHEGYLHVKLSVPLVQEGDDTPEDGEHYCHWMAWQTNQVKAAADLGAVGGTAGL